jgi:GT2 family glycosyltransferase
VDASLDISFVILSWNSARVLDGCLGSIKSDLADSGLSYEAILIDNGSTDGSIEKLRKFKQEGHPLIVVPLGHNTGTTFSRNIALKMARGKYICVLDSDIEFCQAKTLESLITVLDREPRAGILSPMLRYASGNHQKSFDSFPTIANKLKRLFFLRKMERFEGLQQFHAKDLIEVDYTISAFWLFNRELLGSIGYLDEKIFYAPEDVDFCLRSWLGGHAVLFCSDVKVVHLAQEISRKKPFSKSARRHLAGLAYFFMKYGYCFRLDGVRRRIQAAVAAKEKILLAPVEQVIRAATVSPVTTVSVATAVSAPAIAATSVEAPAASVPAAPVVPAAPAVPAPSVPAEAVSAAAKDTRAPG